MARSHTKTDFHFRKDTLNQLPKIEPSSEEREQLEQVLWESIQHIPAKLYDLLGPSASFCHLDEVINSLEKPTIPDQLQSHIGYLLLDYYTCNLDLPSARKLDKKLNHEDYHTYVFGRIKDELLAAVEATYIANTLPKIRIDQSMVNVQLQSHPYLSTQLTVELPIKAEWYLVHAQQCWEQMKQQLDIGIPVMMGLVGKNTLFTQQKLIISHYETTDDHSLKLTGCNLTGNTQKVKLTFQKELSIELLTKGKQTTQKDFKTIQYLEYSPTQPPATTWLERQFHPLIANKQLRRMHRKVKVG
jgi:hypothetical protein